MADDMRLLVQVSKRVFFALAVPFLGLLLFVAFFSGNKYAVPVVVACAGLIGGFLGLQRRLKTLSEKDLQLIADSWIYTCLSPFAGSVLALLLYLLFLSELLSGQLFPIFEPDSPQQQPGFGAIFAQHACGYQEYAKLVFWSFVAGFSERFVTDVISRFQGTADEAIQNQLPNLVEPNNLDSDNSLGG